MRHRQVLERIHIDDCEREKNVLSAPEVDLFPDLGDKEWKRLLTRDDMKMIIGEERSLRFLTRLTDNYSYVG